MNTSEQYTLFDYLEPEYNQLLTPDEIFERVTEHNINTFLEDNRVEWKSGRYSMKQLGDYFSMWANTPGDGGVIFVGLDNDGNIEGLTALGQGKINKIEKCGYDFCPDAQHDIKRIPVTSPSNAKATSKNSHFP